jgi:hypothetical protein
MTPALRFAAILALVYFLIWFLCMVFKKPKSCPANYEWDGAPVFPVCQRQCPKGQISDGRGECVSAEIPFTKLTLDSLGKGRIKSE